MNTFNLVRFKWTLLLTSFYLTFYSLTLQTVLLTSCENLLTMLSWRRARHLSCDTSEMISWLLMPPSAMLVARISASLIFLCLTSSGLSSSTVSSLFIDFLACKDFWAFKLVQLGNDLKPLEIPYFNGQKSIYQTNTLITTTGESHKPDLGITDSSE